MYQFCISLKSVFEIIAGVQAYRKGHVGAFCDSFVFYLPLLTTKHHVLGHLDKNMYMYLIAFHNHVITVLAI